MNQPDDDDRYASAGDTGDADRDEAHHGKENDCRYGDDCPDDHACRDDHDCQAAGTLAFVAYYGAPGIGQSWTCTACGRAWSRVEGMFTPAEWGMHILSPADVE
jgi:hypothetical protein